MKTAAGSPETSATTTEVYDRFGRLHEVTEPNGTVTRYEYGAGNHLKRVCQAVTSTGVCGQERLFTYDNRGFLLWENHPEKLANIHGQGHDVDYPSYDARGHVLRKVDGDNDLSFQYDATERLTLVRETGPGACVTTDNDTNPPLCLKSFTYLNSNGTNAAGLTDYRKGKLTSASRYNYVGVPYNSTVEIKETYEYTGRSGRVSQKETHQIYNGATYEIFRQTFSWNDMGALASQTYPDCVAATVCGPASPRSVSLGYNRGRLTSVSGFATSIGYHPNGLLHTVSRSNGLTDYQDLETSSLLRPAAIYTLRNSDSFGLWNSGTYQYDGSGNVWKMGTTTYVYDNLSRVVSGTVYPGAFSTGTAHTQSYTYDNYGNLKDITTNGALVSTQTATATNRLNGATYDKAGNMTGWNLNTYEYDAFNQMKRMVSGAEDWRYIYTANDERFWSARISGSGSLWTLRGLDGKVLREYSAHLGWSSYRDYVYRDGTLLASVDSSAMGGAVRHLHTDHLGTPRLITDATGNPATAKFHTYYPFGEEIAGTYTSSFTDRMRFTGHERDLANIAGQGDDLDYMHARHYSPATGRFLSVDPMTGSPEEPQSWNRYSYVVNRPLTFTDPTGLYYVVARNPPPVGMTPDEVLQGYYYGMGIEVSSRWRFAPGPNTGLWGAGSLARGRSFLDSLRGLYQERFDRSAVAGGLNYIGAFVDFLALDMIPASYGQLGVELAFAAIPGGRLVKNFKHACKKLGLDPKKASDILHDVKRMTGRGGADEDLLFDIDTGDIVTPDGEIVGNLADDI